MRLLYGFSSFIYESRKEMMVTRMNYEDLAQEHGVSFCIA